MSWPALIAAWMASVVVALGTGWGAHVKYRAGLDAREALAQSESAREAERLAQRHMTKVTDELTTQRLASDRAAASAAERLRQLAATSPDPAPGCAGRNDDPRPAAGVLHDDARTDLESLAREADAVADRLRACQAVVSDLSKTTGQISAVAR